MIRITIKSIGSYRRAEYVCPKCGQLVSIDLNEVELTNVCPKCGQDITKDGENNG